MEDKYEECHKSHEEFGGEKDGCLEFMESALLPMYCAVCGCHRNYHRKVFQYKTEVVYTCCKRVHDFTIKDSRDGCQEFTPKGGVEGTEAALECAACGCHKAFHRDLVSKRVTSTSN